jgi:hypothetical protein
VSQAGAGDQRRHVKRKARPEAARCVMSQPRSPVPILAAATQDHHRKPHRWVTVPFPVWLLATLLSPGGAGTDAGGVERRVRGRDDDEVDGRVLDEHLVVVESVWDVELRGERVRGLLLAAGGRHDLEVVEGFAARGCGRTWPPGPPLQAQGPRLALWSGVAVQPRASDLGPVPDGGEGRLDGSLELPPLIGRVRAERSVNAR